MHWPGQAGRPMTGQGVLCSTSRVKLGVCGTVASCPRQVPVLVLVSVPVFRSSQILTTPSHKALVGVRVYRYLGDIITQGMLRAWAEGDASLGGHGGAETPQRVHRGQMDTGGLAESAVWAYLRKRVLLPRSFHTCRISARLMVSSSSRWRRARSSPSCQLAARFTRRWSTFAPSGPSPPRYGGQQ